MKKLLFLVTLIFACQALYAQDKYSLYSVVAKSGIFLREKPSATSKKLCSIPFMSTVEMIDYTYIDTIIEGLHCSWLKVKYPPFEGYVCWPFVNRKIQKENWNFPLQYPQLLFDGNKPSENCTDFIFYNPNLFWYGVYEESYNFKLKKVDLLLDLAIENITTEVDLDNDYLKFSTNEKNKSLFLIGLPKMINDYVTWRPDGPINGGVVGSPTNKIIYPGETYDIGYCDKENKTYDLYAIGSISEKISEHTFKIENYQVKINEAVDEKIIRSQNILSDLDFLGEGDKPEIKFIGDLDGDDKPDIITFAGYTDHIQYTLFLSSYGENDKIVKKVAVFNGGNCH